MSSPPQPPSEPRGPLMLRAIGQPADTGEGTRMFGGWIMGQMDTAGGQLALRHTGTRMTTVAANDLRFLKPMYVGDEISAHAYITEIRRTSMVVAVEIWYRRLPDDTQYLGTTGSFVFVSMSDEGKPIEIKNKTF
jgi:acyl-CoA thioesterase YciA